MTLIVCALDEVADEIVRSRPARLISLLAPGQVAPGAPASVQPLTLRFHDIAKPRAGLIAPDRAMIAELLAFGGQWTEPEPMIVHCWMGVSRSTAAAMIVACAAAPGRPETDIAWALRKASPSATPNPLMIALADDLLGCGGALVAAVAAIGRGAEAGKVLPFRLRARSR